MILAHARPAPVLAFWVTVMVWGIGEHVLRFRDWRSRATTRDFRDAHTVLWVTAAVVGGFAAGLWLAAAGALPMPAPTVWLVVGLAIAWAGLVLRWWAVRTLGPFFTIKVTVEPDHRVISTGPYRLVRHPAYLGLLVFMFGLGVVLADLASLAAMIVLPALGVLRRVTVEEAALRSALGDSYVAYSQGRARLIPGIW